jgi:hypothetical protein
MDAMPGVPQVDPLPRDAMPGIPQVDPLPLDAKPGTGLVDQVAMFLHPGPSSAAKASTNPQRHAPEPPAGAVRIAERRIAFELSLQASLVADQPGMACMQVAFVDGRLRMMCHGGGIMTYRTPEVAQQAISIIHHFTPHGLWRPPGAGQQHGRRA